MTFAEYGARIDKKIEDLKRKIENLSDKIKLLFLMHDVCPKCHARIRRMDTMDFWRWECPKCGYAYSYNKKYFPQGNSEDDLTPEEIADVEEAMAEIERGEAKRCTNVEELLRNLKDEEASER